MKIRLLKKHKLHTKEIAKGKEFAVSNYLGEQLIKKGIAEDVDGKFIVKNKEDKVVNLQTEDKTIINDSKESNKNK